MRFTSFFKFVKSNFDIETVFTINNIKKLFTLIYKTEARIYFLKECIKLNVIPSHLKHLQNFHLNIHFNNTKRKLKNLLHSYAARILNIEIKESINYLHSLRSQLFFMIDSLYKIFPKNLCDRFLILQEIKTTNLRQKLNSQLMNKINLLVSKNNRSLNTSIQPILFKNQIKNININIHPNIFENPSSLNNLKNDWFINLSGKFIPTEVQLLLQLGDRFNLPVTRFESTIFEYIKCFENEIEKIEKVERTKIRNKVVKFLEKLGKSKNYDNSEKLLQKWLKISIKFIKDNNNILFTRADKGSSTVAIDKDDYVRKMNLLLQDKTTYKIIDKDPINNITNALRQLISRWKNKGYIDQIAYKGLLVTDGVIPRAYGYRRVIKRVILIEL